ncbi:transporter substrate-binding domain-containing protein [candidate division KSB1 bacterium]|nr:transporter substrate-binding domain-containing protein [candidate division KSB1 bacterium]NIR71722.1 transporter substrate-binding domain-containing protein [candidate division KSB1 bacterium]NIS26403.1 transporter substrate-binding domain-containing protein [candidate division KSB1 bacterium]NIT73162.1 transporter substrate-binding domain-containing protein [candidate division KSB1 bacterium]NIU27089.1 transporter substrate-binding domain-containing protein [candidate division KSB1 bacteri
MKKIYITLITLILNVGNLHSQPLESIDIVTGEWSPYVTQRIDGFGVMTKIVTAVLNDMELKPEYTFLHFYKGYELVKEGSIRGTFPYFKTEPREREMFFSDSLFAVRYVFFYQKDRFKDISKIKRLADLAGYKVAIIKGYSYGKKIDAALANMRGVSAYNEINAFRMLQKGEIDLLPASEKVGQDLIRRYFGDAPYEFGIIPDLYSEEYVYFIVSKSESRNKRFIEAFNRSLRKIRQNGVYNDIVNSYYDQALDRYVGQSQTRLVRLTASDSFPLILGRENVDDKETYLIPKGTRAVVVEWSTRFLEKGKFKIYDEMFKKTRVKLMEGPLKGKTLWVNNLHIEFE